MKKPATVHTTESYTENQKTESGLHGATWRGGGAEAWGERKANTQPQHTSARSAPETRQLGKIIRFVVGKRICCLFSPLSFL